MVDWFKRSERFINHYTKGALLLGAVATVVISAMFESVVSVWYAFGSIGTPIMLVPLVSTFLGNRRMPPVAVIVSMILSGAATGIWLYSSKLSPEGSYWLGLEPIFIGLAISLLIYLLTARRTTAQVQ